MAKVKVENETEIRYHCPGCKHDHIIPFDRWHFNGDINIPTVSPSVRHFTTDPESKVQTTICHYFIRNGRIEYCNDCQHSLSGQIVEMENI